MNPIDTLMGPLDEFPTIGSSAMMDSMDFDKIQSWEGYATSTSMEISGSAFRSNSESFALESIEENRSGIYGNNITTSGEFATEGDQNKNPALHGITTIIGSRANNIHHVSANDILVGSGEAALYNPGNKAFRHLVKQNTHLAQEYAILAEEMAKLAAKLKEKEKQISDQVHSILSKIKMKGGRFLKLVQYQEDGKCQFLVLSDEDAIEKTKDAVKKTAFIQPNPPVPASSKAYHLRSSFSRMSVSGNGGSKTTEMPGVHSMNCGAHSAIDDKNRYVEDLPTNDDVLCGSGKRIMDHPGNIHFRALVREYSRGKDEKIGASIVDKIMRKGGRFLKLLPSNNASNNDWHILTREEAVSKTATAIRDKKNGAKKKGASPGGVHTPV